MKRTNQMRKGNIAGTGHGTRAARKGLIDSFASVPRNEPYPRHIRRYIRLSRSIKANMPKWAMTAPLLDWLLYRAGVYELDPPNTVVA